MSELADGADDERGANHAEQREGDALECARHQRRGLQCLGHGIHAQEDQQADGECQEEVHPLAVNATQKREPKQPDEHRDHADIDPDQRKGEQVARTGRRGPYRDIGDMAEGEAGTGDERDGDRLSGHPRVADGNVAAPQPFHRPGAVHVVHPVGLIHHHLRDGDRLRASIHHRGMDYPRLWERQPLDGEFLDRRKHVAGEVGGAKAEHHHHHQREQQQREHAPEPERHSRAPAGHGPVHGCVMHGARAPPGRSPSSPARRTRSDARGT